MLMRLSKDGFHRKKTTPEKNKDTSFVKTLCAVPITSVIEAERFHCTHTCKGAEVGI